MAKYLTRSELKTLREYRETVLTEEELLEDFVDDNHRISSVTEYEYQFLIDLRTQFINRKDEWIPLKEINLVAPIATKIKKAPKISFTLRRLWKANMVRRAKFNKDWPKARLFGTNSKNCGVHYKLFINKGN